MAPGEMCPRIFVLYPYSIVTYLNTYQNIFCLLVLLVLSSCVQLVQSGLIYLIDISELTHSKLKTCRSQSQPHLKFPDYLKSSFPSWWHIPFFLFLGPQTFESSSVLSFLLSLDPLMRSIFISIKYHIISGVSQMPWSPDTLWTLGEEPL